KDPKFPSMAMLATKTPTEERRLKTPCTTVISSPQTLWPTSLNSQSAQSAQLYSHCFLH
ncbi:CUB and sushi domain-containing protein 2 isoform X1, partial [Clarias magur]